MQKLDENFKTQNVNFDESECVFNVIAKKVLNPKLAEEFLAHETIGKELLENPRLDVMLKPPLLR